MPDFTLCTGGNCKARFTCKRYLVVRLSLKQSWMEPPGIDESCEFYLSINRDREPEKDLENRQGGE